MDLATAMMLMPGSKVVSPIKPGDEITIRLGTRPSHLHVCVAAQAVSHHQGTAAC